MAIFPQPGWYPDPHSIISERLWNGLGWTEYSRPLGSHQHSGEIAWFGGFLPGTEVALKEVSVTTLVQFTGEQALDSRSDRYQASKVP